MKTGGWIFNLMSQKSQLPTMYWIGILASRAVHSFSKRFSCSSFSEKFWFFYKKIYKKLANPQPFFGFVINILFQPTTFSPPTWFNICSIDCWTSEIFSWANFFSHFWITSFETSFEKILLRFIGLFGPILKSCLQHNILTYWLRNILMSTDCQNICQPQKPILLTLSFEIKMRIQNKLFFYF